ncbi:MAG: YceI family protein [Myxococcales bacterium]|nr:YceI family protein [Myxococcales bacterium]MCB9546984.1 YceI family protein [Myxococcales bacterium]
MQSINTGNVHLFVFKEGLLSALGHDLRLGVREFRVDLDEDQVQATFRVDSIRVDGVMRDGRFDDGGLSPKQKREILDNINSKVLLTRRHPEIVFRGRRNGMKVTGDLAMVGRSNGVELTVTHVSGRYRGRVEIKPLRWGIAPFSAMLGALKIQDRVVVEFELPDA